MAWKRINLNFYVSGDATPPTPPTPEDDFSDLFISLKPLASDIEAQVMGLTLDTLQTSYIKKDINSEIDGTLRVYESGGIYYADYSLDGTYKLAQSFTVETALELDLYSATRLGASDLSALSLTIDNETAMTLYINRRSEDYSNPRLSVIINTGTVIFR